MKVLVACEYSGIVRDAFAKKGHDAWSCDILPTKSKGNHIQDNVLNHLNKGWDLMIAHPPCTYLCRASARWLYKNKKDKEMKYIIIILLLTSCKTTDINPKFTIIKNILQIQLTNQ